MTEELFFGKSKKAAKILDSLFDKIQDKIALELKELRNMDLPSNLDTQEENIAKKLKLNALKEHMKALEWVKDQLLK